MLILSNYFHPEPTGSAPPISDLAAWAGENGFRPDVITARPSYPFSEVYSGYEDGQKDADAYHGARVRRVASFIPRSRGLIGRLVGELSFALAALAGRKRRYNGVVCVCPSIFVVFFAPFFRKKAGRVVVIVHDIQSGLAQSLKFKGAGPILSVLRVFEAWSLNRCDHLVALTAEMAGELRKLGVHRPIDILPPQVDVREIVPQPEPAGQTPILLYSGNLGRKQGLDQILTLARSLMDRHIPAVVHVRGRGSERAELEAEAQKMALTNVHFSDLADRDQISVALGEAALHLVPQDPAGARFALPSKVFSIMAARRAFVATADPGSPLGNVADASGGGVCVPAKNPEAFADAIQTLLNDKALREELGRAGREYVEREIDREIICRKLVALLIREPGS